MTPDKAGGPVADLIAGGSAFSSDTSPAWSLDSSAVYFVRSTWDGQTWSTTIDAVSAAGGVTTPILNVDAGYPLTVPTGSMVVTNDGSLIVTRALDGAADANNGIWKVSIFGKEITQLYGYPPETTGVPLVRSVAADSLTLLVLLPGNSTGTGLPPTWALLTSDGSMQVIARDGATLYSDGLTVAAGFAPDGRSLVYLWQPPDGQGRQIVHRSLTNGRESDIALNVPAAIDTGGETIVWTAGGPLVVTIRGEERAVIRISAEQIPPPPAS